MNDDFLGQRPPLAKRDTSPIFRSEPVIIVHLKGEGGLTACAGVPFSLPPEDSGYPLVLCPGCAFATGKFRPGALVRNGLVQG